MYSREILNEFLISFSLVFFSWFEFKSLIAFSCGIIKLRNIFLFNYYIKCFSIN